MRPPPFILVRKSNAPNRGETGPNGAVFRPGGPWAQPPPGTGTQGPHGANGTLSAGPDRGPGVAAVPPPDTGPGNLPAPCRPAPGSRRPSSPTVPSDPAPSMDTRRRTPCLSWTPDRHPGRGRAVRCTGHRRRTLSLLRTCRHRRRIEVICYLLAHRTGVTHDARGTCLRGVC